MNYGETIAYWYFRLNGFVPMTNLVLHEPDNDTQYKSDSDLLAVRFPYVFEEIGGRPEDWDNERFNHWGLDHLHSTVIVFCEVKTGAYKKKSINKSFSSDRLRYAVSRVGFLDPSCVQDAVQELGAKPTITRGSNQITKVLINVAKHRPGESAGWPSRLVTSSTSMTQ